MLAALCLSSAAMTVGPSSQAAGPDPALTKAREQFRQAISLEAGGDWTGALTLLRDVASVKMTPQVRYNIALCEEHLGQLVSALGDYEMAAADAQEANAQDVTQVVGPRLESLRVRIPKLVVKRGKDATVAAITVDGVVLGAPMVGKEMPMNPGPHAVEAKAAGYKPFKVSIELAEKDSKTIEVSLVALQSGSEPIAGLIPTSSSTAPVDVPPKKKNVLPFVVGGIEAASLITSGVFYLLRAGTTSDLDAACGPNRDTCPADAQSTYDKGRTYNTVANITLAVGVVGVGAGVVLYLTTGKPTKAPSTASVGIAPTPGGASLIGRF